MKGPPKGFSVFSQGIGRLQHEAWNKELWQKSIFMVKLLSGHSFWFEYPTTHHACSSMSSFVRLKLISSRTKKGKVGKCLFPRFEP